MSILEIKQNIDDLDKKEKNVLVRYIHELLIYEKRQESKFISLKTEIKFLKRHLTKIRDLINKMLLPKLDGDDKIWENKK